MGADVQRMFLSNEDQILLCTDGLTDMVSPAAITAALRDSKSSQIACRVLVEKALENGGRGNVTVVLGGHAFPTRRPFLKRGRGALEWADSSLFTASSSYRQHRGTPRRFE